MKVLVEIPKEEFKITVYIWNGKYLIKFERGSYEQTYKLAEMDVTGDDDIKKLIDDQSFLNSVTETFKMMSGNFKEAVGKI
jgi:hypothetical protein